MCIQQKKEEFIMKTGFAFIGSSLLLGFFGLNLDGAIGSGEGHLLAATGFFLPVICLLGLIYEKK